MSREIENKALELSETAAKEQGVYVVDVSYSRNEEDTNSLCFYIDKEGGIGIDECEKFSRAVEDVLDRDDIISENYVLEVSSPGVDRILKKEREFLYYIGREVDVKLYSSLNGVKEFTGILKGYCDNTAEIEYNGENVSIPVKSAVYIRLSFKF